MSIRFIYGRAGSGKSTFCLQQIKNRIEKGEGEKLILLVPEQFSFKAEKNLLDSVGERALKQAEVLSFKRMSNRILDEVGGIAHKRMNDAGKNMLLFKILDQISDKLKFFYKASKQQGFVDILAEVITEFKRYNITPKIIKESLNKIEDLELKNKLEDLSSIYDDFQGYIESGYIDSEEELTILARKLDESNYFHGAEVWIDEFSTFTPQQYSIIEKLLRTCKRVNITLCCDGLNGNNEVDNTDVFSVTKNTERKLLKIIQESGIGYEKPIDLNKECCKRFEHSKELQHIERHFFSFPYKYYNPPVKNLRIYKALNSYDEVEKVARDIVSLVRDKDYRFKDIAVVCRELSDYEKIVSVIFKEYNIPFFLDKKRDVTDNPLVVLITSIFDIFIKNWSYESVFRYIKTGLIKIPREDIDVLENYILAYGIRGSHWTHDEIWKFGFDDNKELSLYEADKLNKINEVKDTIREPLLKLHSSIKNDYRVLNICSSIYEFLRESGTLETIEQWSKDFSDKGEQEKSDEYDQITDIVMQVLDQMVDVMGEERVKLDKFINMLNVGFEKYEMGLIPVSLDEVLVGDIGRIKSHDIRSLYIIGVNDGVFPRSSREEGILSDFDRNILKENGVELAPDTKTQAFEEQFLVYTALTMGKEYMMITYPMADFEGKALRPSIIISRMKKLFPKIIEESDIVNNVEDNFEYIVSPEPTFNELISTLRRNFEGEETEKIWSEVYYWYRDKEQWKDKIASVFKGFKYNNLVEKADEDKIKALYMKPFNFDVSRIEKYAECPFAYYVQYGLKARDRKIYEFSAPDIGSFMHDVIDKFSDKVKEESLSWRELDVDWCRTTISSLVEETIDDKNAILKSSAKYKYMAGRMKKIISKSIMIISEHIKRSSFEPLANELKFGLGYRDLKPIEISLPSGEMVTLQGRIDRIDSMELEDKVYIRIIDYKTGNKDFSLSDVYYGLQLQLLVYLEAILENADKFMESQTLPGAILYFRVDDPIVKGKKALKEEEVENLILKKLKMRGLLLADAKVVKEMDNDIEGYSLIIPARINKDGSLGKSSAITLEEFDVLREYVKETLVKLCDEMLSGDISIKPIKKDKYTSCSYCKFSSICQFDASIKGNKYENINKKTDEEALELIYKQVSNRLIIESKGGDSDGRN
ncbi:helicase-exonuclease AddAB subunit AddB [Clostridium amazonitimonense]|uniref:helicase-exonuclease AddAB subunit AddB n=1 Tax=Clostridium amazonitimonense TaxID=1499689 RepID=UPI0005A616A8|nr:helicase-exonuclease AddAB subunit AddB [Clostridium amazonitimonense]